MNRTIIVTGASRGLGLYLSKRFVMRGDQVIGISQTKKYWKEARAFVRDSRRFKLVQLNLISEKKVSHFFTQLKKEKIWIDILVNNAGYAGTLQRVEDISAEELNKNWQHNLVSQFLTIKYAFPFFKKQKKGFIVNISSMAGKRAVPRLFPYSASKFAVLALSQCVAKENAENGIKCITVCPSGMNTEMRAKLFGKKDASLQQSSDFVADIVMKVIHGKIEVLSGGDIVICHGKIKAINPPPSA